MSFTKGKYNFLLQQRSVQLLCRCCVFFVFLSLIPTTTFAQFYWVTGGSNYKVKSANLDGSGVALIYDEGGSSPMRAVDVDLTISKAFYSVGDSIKSINLDGSGNATVLSSLGSSIITGIVLNVESQHIYWTEADSGKIRRANYNGTAAIDIATGLIEPFGLTIDIGNGKLYYTDRTADVVYQSNLNGSSQTAIITTNLNGPRGITFDQPGNKIYVLESGSQLAQYNLSGGDRVVLTSALSSAFGVRIDSVTQQLYIAAFGNNAIRRIGADGSGLANLVTAGTGADLPQDLSLGKDAGATPIPTFTGSPTPTSTPTITQTPTVTRTPTVTATATRTSTPTRTPTNTATQTQTRTPTNTATHTGTPTITRTATPTRTETPTRTITNTPTQTRTFTPTRTRTPTRTFTPTRTQTPTISPTFTVTPTETPTELPTITPSPTPTLSASEIRGYIEPPVPDVIMYVYKLKAGQTQATQTEDLDAFITAISDETGSYTFKGNARQRYHIIPLKSGFDFSPASIDVAAGTFATPFNASAVDLGSDNCDVDDTTSDVAQLSEISETMRANAQRGIRLIIPANSVRKYSRKVTKNLNAIFSYSRSLPTAVLACPIEEGCTTQSYANYVESYRTELIALRNTTRAIAKRLKKLGSKESQRATSILSRARTSYREGKEIIDSIPTQTDACPVAVEPENPEEPGTPDEPE